MPDVIAIIPARGGSKGVVGKNKRRVGGKPLIAYSIAAAREASRVGRIVVTTDDPEIGAIARGEGAEVVMRPENIAGDDSPVIDAVLHALAELDLPAGPIVLLQPTSPLRNGADIDAAIALYEQTGAPVCSVCQAEDAHPARMYRIEEGRLCSLMPELAERRRQDLPAVYHRNGAIYIFGAKELAARRIIGPDMAPFVMPGETSVNIDTELDLLLLEAVLARGA